MKDVCVRAWTWHVALGSLFMMALTTSCDPDVLCDYDGDGLCPPEDCDDYDVNIDECEPTGVPSQPTNVTFVVSLRYGNIDDNCEEIDPSSWMSSSTGDSMFIVGGVHPDSEIQGEEYSALLGNWVPNLIPLYDDGTHGDALAGDALWTGQFEFPIGIKLGYKYTFGQMNDTWTESEEFPGNQRLLEVVDVNGDGKVIRVDEFADQTTNKDRNNCYGGACNKTIDWTSDQNGDDIPDARERMVDADNNCTLDFWPVGY